MYSRKLLSRCTLAIVMTLAAIELAQHGIAPASAETVRLNDTLQSVKGGTEALSRYEGKIVVVNFWAPWCAPCRRKVPDFVSLQKKYA